MRAFADVVRFELQLHLRSPLYWGVAALFFVLHFLTLTRTGINLGDNEQIALNSPFLIFQTEIVLGVFGMVPAIVFAVTAITRDHERNTHELFWATPVPRTAFVLGRFSAGTLAAASIALAGVLGALAGSFMPWLDPDRIAPFDWRAWLVSYGALALPNVIVFCAIFFAVGALTRSTAMTIGAALAVIVLEVLLNLMAGVPVARWLLLADPFGALPVAEASRFWTVSELNAQLPTALLLPNRLLWLTLAALALVFTCWRHRMELVSGAARAPRPHAAPAASVLPPALPAPRGRFDPRSTWLQLRSQLRMDARAVLSSPLFWIVLALAAVSVYAESTGQKSQVLGLPLYPSTTLMLGFFRFGLMQYVLVLVLWYSAYLVHRERDCGIAGMSGAAPCPAWVPVTSKTLVACGVSASLLLVSMATSIGVQALAAHPRYELGLYLQGLFVYNGFYFGMLCVLAVLIQVLSPGKWSGMLLTLAVFVALLSLFVVGFEHLLYGFRIPFVVHSDMNGFGHFRLPTYTLIAYWGAFCVLLLVASHLFYPRGDYSSLRERLDDARTRITPAVTRVAAVALVAVAGMGAFIFYNTNFLNEYTTVSGEMERRARYELAHGRYRDAPAPSLTFPDVRVDLYPAERRLESRGSARLLNTGAEAIGDFVVSVDTRNRVDELAVEGARLVQSDPAQGFHLFRPDSPLLPGSTLRLRWAFARENPGFRNADPDNEIVANGTYLRGSHLPLPGYCVDCELESGRERFGLPPAVGLPQLGDPAHLDDLWPGIDVRSGFRIVIGTDADQTAVAPGSLRRTWSERGRRYFEYSMAGPVWPLVSMLSARYAVARDEWHGVALEIYHDPKHAWNVRTMLDTMKKALDYYTREFGPYPLPYFRMAAYPRYRSNVQAGVGLIAYSEIAGFMTDLREGPGMDYGVLHELAHMWWGNVYGARMQGRQILNEGLAQYSTFMMLEQHADPKWVRRALAETHDGYLNGRKGERRAEQPVVRTDINQEYLSYGKSALILFALQELVGADKVNGALRAYHSRFVEMQPPFPTSLDLVAELRAVVGPEHQELITDLFEKIVLYDVSVLAAESRAVAGGHEVDVELRGRQLEAGTGGAETEVPLDTWFQVAVFPDSDRPLDELEPLYLQHHRLRTGAQRITVRVGGKPGRVAIDPFHLMIDRRRVDNVLQSSPLFPRH